MRRVLRNTACILSSWRVLGSPRSSTSSSRSQPSTVLFLVVFHGRSPGSKIPPPLIRYFMDLESWYEWFYGEDIGPPPEDHVLAIAERNAWRKIHEKMHEGNTLKAAMLSVRQDTLFWTREVYEKIKTFSRGRPSTRTSMDYAPPQKGKNKSKGKGKSKGKPGNKGKGKTPGAVTSRQPPTRKGTSSVTTGCARAARATAAAPTSATSSWPHLPGGPPPAGLPGLTRGADPYPPGGLRCRGP